MRASAARSASLAGQTVHTTTADPAAPRHPDLVKRHIAATAPNQLWVTDLTFVPPGLRVLHPRRSFADDRGMAGGLAYADFDGAGCVGDGAVVTWKYVAGVGFYDARSEFLERLINARAAKTITAQPIPIRGVVDWKTPLSATAIPASAAM